MKKLLYILSFALLFGALSCEKETTSNAENPFLDQQGPDTSVSKLSLSTIEGLHQNVFAVKCANPTCHDGSFEPDFRTVQSTYSSLVYHPVTKNDDQGSYTYRVHPGKANESWITHRVTTDDEVLGRMPLYAKPLSTEEINGLKTWINNGAKDVNGNLPDFPNLPPTVYGYQALDANNDRVDTNRVNGWASAMTLGANQTYTLVFYVEDDTSATADLKNQKVEFSLSRDNFVPMASIPVIKLWENVTVATLNTSQFSSNTTIYFRYYLEDEHGNATQMPSNQSQYWWKENFSFILP